MNTPQQNVDKTAEHEGLIKTPKQLITVIILAFVVPITVILLLIRLVTASSPLGVGSDAQSQEAVASRIQPVARFALVSAEAGSEERTGEQVYSSTCSACHTAGVAGAPKLGDTAAWAPLIEKGYEALLQNAINGINAMPPRGGNPALSDLEVARAVVHITNQSGGNFPEPEAGAEGSADTAATTSEPQTQTAAAAATAATDESTGADTEQKADQAATQAADKEAAPADAQANGEQPAAAAGSDIDLAAGEQLYKSVCFACHTAGVAGAPKLGDKAAWEPLIAAGMDQMIKIAIEGKGAMPPRGGSSASDEEIAAAVHYMVNAVK